MLTEDEILINRTCNPWTRKNKHMNGIFGVGKGKGSSPIAEFISKISDESDRYLTLISNASRIERTSQTKRVAIIPALVNPAKQASKQSKKPKIRE